VPQSPQRKFFLNTNSDTIDDPLNFNGAPSSILPILWRFFQLCADGALVPVVLPPSYADGAMRDSSGAPCNI
jgi:hypothetical protein